MTGVTALSVEALRGNTTLGRVVRFTMVGGTVTVLYVLLGWLLHAGGMPIVAASFTAQVATIVLSYFAQKAFSFGIAGQHLHYGPRYALAIVALVVSAQGVVWLVDAAGAGPEAALLANAIYYPAASFLLQFLWVFKDREGR